MSGVPLKVLVAMLDEPPAPHVLDRARKLDQEATVLARQARHAFAQRMSATARSCAERAAERRAASGRRVAFPNLTSP